MLDLARLDHAVLGDDLAGAEVSCALLLDKQHTAKGASAEGAVDGIVVEGVLGFVPAGKVLELCLEVDALLLLAGVLRLLAVISNSKVAGSSGELLRLLLEQPSHCSTKCLDNGWVRGVKGVRERACARGKENRYQHVDAPVRRGYLMQREANATPQIASHVRKRFG